MKTFKILIVMLCMTGLIISCGGLKVKETPQIDNPTLKLRIEGVENVKVQSSEVDDSSLDFAKREMVLKEKRFELEAEKWIAEKKQNERELLKSKLSSYCNFETTYPTIDLYSTITMMDWRNIQKDFEVLMQHGHKKVILRLFSGGGSAFAGMGVADSILEWRNRGLDVEGRAYGIIASATVPIFASCSTRISSPSTLFMVHEAAMFKFFTIDKHSDINAQKVMFDKMQHQYCSLLAQHSKKSLEFWIDLETKTTWFGAGQAKDWGLVDKIE